MVSVNSTLTWLVGFPVILKVLRAMFGLFFSPYIIGTTNQPVKMTPNHGLHLSFRLVLTCTLLPKVIFASYWASVRNSSDVLLRPLGDHVLLFWLSLWVTLTSACLHTSYISYILHMHSWYLYFYSVTICVFYYAQMGFPYSLFQQLITNHNSSHRCASFMSLVSLLSPFSLISLQINVSCSFIHSFGELPL